MADIAMHDDINALHRNPATRRCIAFDHEEAAATRCTGILACVAINDNRAGHHIFRNTRTGRALDANCRQFVHSTAIIPGGSSHCDINSRIKANCNGVCALRIDDFPCRLVGLALQRVKS